jgi:hypothetical protein
MLGLDMLDVAIGVVFVYLLLSLIASAAAEVWESKWKMRAVYLERGLLELLRDKDLVAKFYNHPLINGLYQGTYGDPETKPQLPTYIPTRSFALAIMDLLLSSTGTTPAPTPSDTPADVLAMRTTVDAKAVVMQPSGNTPTSGNAAASSAAAGSASQDPLINQARHAVVVLTNAAAGDAEQARKNIEDWYNTAMDRVSGWYKRRTQWFLFGIGLLVAIVLNVDSIRVVTALSTDKPKRDAIVGIAVAYQKANPTPTTTATDTSGTTKSPATAAEKQTSAALGELNKLGLPIGWKNYGCALCEATPETPCPSTTKLSFWQICKKIQHPHWLRCWLLIFVGWLITALAVSLGAPFWFDMLNKIIVVRSTVKPQEKSGTEAPKDPPKK